MAVENLHLGQTLLSLLLLQQRKWREEEDEDEKSDGKFATLEDDRKIKAATGGTVRETVDQTVAGYLQSIRSTDAIKKFKKKIERKKEIYIYRWQSNRERGRFFISPIFAFLFPSCIKNISSFRRRRRRIDSGITRPVFSWVIIPSIAISLRKI
jgi:serine/threonine-protein kinase RIO1